MAKFKIAFAPVALKDIKKLPKNRALQILDDIEQLREYPWPRAKKYKSSEYWSIRTGNYRTIFLPIKREVIILRIIDRKELSKVVNRIDVRALFDWVRSRK